MPKTLTFYSIAEKMPEHEQNIVCVSKYGHELQNMQVTYHWEEVDEQGFTGCSVCYRGEESLANHELELLGENGWVLTEDTLWCSEKDFDKLFNIE